MWNTTANISKEAIQNAASTLYNCPIVCNYDVESDTIGGHDVKAIKDDSGNIRLVNLTSAIGVVPSGANMWWSSLDDNGTSHDYFCAEAILWKRSPAYEKVANDGVVSQSMEIAVSNGKLVDGEFMIDAFQFQALCLLGDNYTPCFEQANLSIGMSGNLKYEWEKMMQDFAFYTKSTQLPANGVSNIEEDSNMKGGEETLAKETTSTIEFEIKENEVSGSAENEETSEQKVEFASESDEGQAPEQDPNVGEEFELNSNLSGMICEALSAQTYVDRWGENVERYFYIDHDEQSKMVYAIDCQDNYHLYGIPFSMDGDVVNLDYASASRKKYAIVDLNQGEEEQGGISQAFSQKDARYDELHRQNEELTKFKLDTEAAETDSKKATLLGMFSDLNGNDAFENLKENAKQFSLETLEEKCYAIRGRMQKPAQMTFSQKTTKLPVVSNETQEKVHDPYNGIFQEFGISE